MVLHPRLGLPALSQSLYSSAHRPLPLAVFGVFLATLGAV